MADHDQDARHPASPIRLLQAQRGGDFARSQELASSIQLFCGVAASYFLTKALVSQFSKFTTNVWTQPSDSLATIDSFSGHMSELFGELAMMVLPLLGVILGVAVLSHLIQNTTLSFFNKPVLELRSVNPATGLQRMFSAKNFLRTALGIPKIAILITVCCIAIWNLKFDIANLAFSSTNDMTTKMIDCVFTVLIVGTSTLLALSTLDYIMERIGFVNRHRMTDQQLRDENRMQDTDPQISARRQQFYQDIY